MKTCKKCDIEKPLDCFGTRKLRNGALAYVGACKECVKAHYKSYRQANVAVIKAGRVAHRATHSEQMKETDRQYYQDNRERLKAKSKAWADQNRDRRLQTRRDYYETNREEVLEKQRVRGPSTRGKPSNVAKKKAWRANNRGGIAALRVKRRAGEIHRTPAWADLDAIKLVYNQAQERSKRGTAFVVDHVIPLQGKLVSGLHVADNLQVITALENARKHNKFAVE